MGEEKGRGWTFGLVGLLTPVTLWLGLFFLVPLLFILAYSFGTSGTRKKSPSQRVTGVSRPTSPKVQPRPFSSPMLRALYLGEAALVVAGHLSQVLDDLQPVFHLGRQGVVWELRERVGQHRERGLIWRVEVEVAVECRADLGVEDVVYELVGI